MEDQFLGVKTATFGIIGNGKMSQKLTEIHAHLKDKVIQGLSKPPAGLVSDPDGVTLHESNAGLFISLKDCNQNALNLNLPVQQIHQHTDGNARFNPISKDVVFEYSELNWGTQALATAAAGKSILLTVHYQ